MLIRNREDIEKINQTPLASQLNMTNTYALIRQSAKQNPDRLALRFIPSGEDYQKSIDITYAELLANLHRCANLFHSLGIGSNDVVSYLLPAIPQTHFVLWGAEAVGIANPINPLLEAETIKGICEAANTRILVVYADNPEIWAKVEQIRDQLPNLTSVIGLTETEDSHQYIHFNRQMASQNSHQLDFKREIQADDTASLYHTGGTTGTPKLAIHSHINEVSMAWMICIVANIQRMTTLLCGLPLFHVNATTITGLAPFLVGAEVVLLSPLGYRNPNIIQNFYKVIDFYQANFFSSVPTVLSALLEIPVAGANIDSLDYAICGAAPLSVELFKRFEAHSGVKILEGYGLTEGACASAVNPRDGQRKIGSIGICMPYQQMSIKMLDEQGHYQREAKKNEIGSVFIQGPNVCKGYIDPLHNINTRHGNWFNTGDLGREDEDGYFWLTGRKKELIIRGGHNIDPALIEEVFYQRSDVKIVAAVACPHPRLGEVAVVFVQLAQGANTSSDELLRYAEKHIGERAAIPKQVLIVEQIPLTAVGKIFKPALRWKITQQALIQALANIPLISLDINVGEDKHYGTRADISATTPSGTEKQTQALIQNCLADYALHAVIEMEGV